MTDREREREELPTEEELEEQSAEDLPGRNAMSLINPGVLGGTTGLPILGGSPTTGDPTASAPVPSTNVGAPHLPVDLPTTNPDGTYDPSTSSSSTS